MQPLIVYTEQAIVMVCFLILRYDHIYHLNINDESDEE